MAKRTGAKNAKPTNRQRRARRDVRIAQQPQLNAIDREQALAQQNAERAMSAVSSAYGGYQNLLGNMPDFQKQVSGISTNLQNQLAGLSAMLGGSSMLPEGESAAGTGLGTTIGSGALEALASQAAREGQYQASAQREGGIAQREATGNLVQNLNDVMSGFQNRRLDVTDQSAQLIKQRMDELRQQALENQVVKQKMASDAALSQYLMGQVGNIGGGGGGGFGGGGGGGGGGGKPPRATTPKKPPKNAGSRRNWSQKDATAPQPTPQLPGFLTNPDLTSWDQLSAFLQGAYTRPYGVNLEQYYRDPYNQFPEHPSFPSWEGFNALWPQIRPILGNLYYNEPSGPGYTYPGRGGR